HATVSCEGTLGAAPVEGAVTLRYRFAKGWRFAELKPQTRSISTREPRAFALWIHGDCKGCQARLRFTDATGQTFQPDGPKIDFTGWRFVKFPMQSTPDAPLSHWGGANDGVIHYPIKWDSIFVL